MADTCGAACYMKDDGAETDMTYTRMAGADVVESAAVALLGVGSIQATSNEGGWPDLSDSADHSVDE